MTQDALQQVPRHGLRRAGEAALPSLQMLASKEGIRGFVEFYTGAPLSQRARRVSTVSEWKEHLVGRGAAPCRCPHFLSRSHPPHLRPGLARLAGPAVGAASST